MQAVLYRRMCKCMKPWTCLRYAVDLLVWLVVSTNMIYSIRQLDKYARGWHKLAQSQNHSITCGKNLDPLSAANKFGLFKLWQVCEGELELTELLMPTIMYLLLLLIFSAHRVSGVPCAHAPMH